MRSSDACRLPNARTLGAAGLLLQVLGAVVLGAADLLLFQQQEVPDDSFARKRCRGPVVILTTESAALAASPLGRAAVLPARLGGP